MLETITFPFPFAIDNGRIQVQGGDAALRGKIIQVLFTAPGERINLPEFGCGLFNLVFEPNDVILAATTEFTIREALNRWLRDELQVNDVAITQAEETITVVITYTRIVDQTSQALRVHFK